MDRTTNRRGLYVEALDLDRGQGAVRTDLAARLDDGVIARRPRRGEPKPPGHPLLLSAIFVMLRAYTRPARWLTHIPQTTHDVALVPTPESGSSS